MYYHNGINGMLGLLSTEMYSTLFRTCIEQIPTNAEMGAISYWLPIGREPGKYL
jgi:hypothetical protein